MAKSFSKMPHLTVEYHVLSMLLKDRKRYELLAFDLCPIFPHSLHFLPICLVRLSSKIFKVDKIGCLLSFSNLKGPILCKNPRLTIRLSSKETFAFSAK